MRPTLLFASILILGGCADVLAVEGGALDGELGAVRDLEAPTTVEATESYTGGSRVSLDVIAPDGRRLMLFVTLPASFAEGAVGDEWGHGTHYVEGEVQPISAVWGCSKAQPGPWDIDTGADGGSVVVVPSDTPGMLRAEVQADFRLDEAIGEVPAGELQTLTGSFDFVPGG